MRRFTYRILLAFSMALCFSTITACSDDENELQEFDEDGNPINKDKDLLEAAKPPDPAPIQDFQAALPPPPPPPPEVKPVPAPVVENKGNTMDPNNPMAKNKRVYYVASLYAPTYEQPNTGSKVKGSCLRGEHYLVIMDGDWASLGPSEWVHRSHLVSTPVPKYRAPAIWSKPGAYATESDAH